MSACPCSSTNLSFLIVTRAYAARMSFYRLKQFQCEVTGKSGLDYFQALESERQEARTLHSRFSAALKPAVLKAVQWRMFSVASPIFYATTDSHVEVVGRLDHLVEAVYERYKDRYFQGERASRPFHPSPANPPPQELW